MANGILVNNDNVVFDIVEGTSPDTLNTIQDIAPFPTGYNDVNIIVLGFSIDIGDSWIRTDQDNSLILIIRKTYGIRGIVPSDSNFLSKPVKILIARKK